MASRDPERRYQRDKVDQLELTQKPFGGIVFPAAVPPSLSAMRPKPSNNPAVQLVEALANLGSAVHTAPYKYPRAIEYLAELPDDHHGKDPSARPGVTLNGAAARQKNSTAGQPAFPSSAMTARSYCFLQNTVQHTCEAAASARLCASLNPFLLGPVVPTSFAIAKPRAH